MEYVPTLQLLADYKYDHYQRFAPGKRFIESLALWLQEFEEADRQAALDIVMSKLVYLSDAEFSHLVQHAYPDVIVQERMRLVSEEKNIPLYRVAEIAADPRFRELRLKSLYLGLSDGARTNELRRAGLGEIGNEQIWQAYELGDAKAEEMLEELRQSMRPVESAPVPATAQEFWELHDNSGREASERALEAVFSALESKGSPEVDARFNLIWLLDDFSGSGNTYIRFDAKSGRYKGKIKKIYERLHKSSLIDPSHYEVYLLLYVATRQAIDHIEYWAERFTSENKYKPLQLRVLCPLQPEVSLNYQMRSELKAILQNKKYYDAAATDRHIKVGGTEDAVYGFANCALPVVLSHNTPNNSVYILWGPESYRFQGLFPRVSRHREF